MNVSCCEMSEIVPNMLLNTVQTYGELREFPQDAPQIRKQNWEKACCMKDVSDICVSTEGKPVLPDSLLPAMVHHCMAQPT